MAIGAQLGIRAAERVLIHFPFAIVGDEQVQKPIVVVVHPGSRDGPHLLAIKNTAAHTRFVGDVGEGAIVVVVEQLVLTCVNHVDIGPPIVIVIPDSHAHAIAFAGHTCFFSHIGEGAIVVVVVQPIPVFGALFLERRDGGSVYHIDIQVAVVVVIEKSYSRHHGLRLILIRRGLLSDTNVRPERSAISSNTMGPVTGPANRAPAAITITVTIEVRIFMFRKSQSSMWRTMVLGLSVAGAWFMRGPALRRTHAGAQTAGLCGRGSAIEYHLHQQ